MARDVGVVIPAAGQGQRLGGRSKALVTLAGAPLLLHSLQVISRHPAVGPITAAIREEDRAELEGVLREHGMAARVALVAGGASRCASVANAVRSLPAEAAWVVVHDAARPCLDDALLSRVIDAVREHHAVAAGLPAPMTVKTVDREQMVRLTLDRESLWLAQTPQAFRREWLEAAIARVGERLDQMPDDAAACEWAGYPVRMVPGDALNIKVTVPDDLVIADAILKARQQSPDQFEVQSSKFEEEKRKGKGADGRSRQTLRTSNFELRTAPSPG